MNTPDPANACRTHADHPARGGLYARISATAALLVLSGLSAGRLASASYDQISAPIGDVATLDGIVSGTIRITGGRFVFFSGDRIQSTNKNLAVNFASGGSLVLCPHSQVQILAANHNTGIMVAFQEGGSEQPFPVHTNDVVMTPDWRIEMLGDVHQGDTGILQLSTSRRGDLCLASNVQSRVYFRVSQLVGDASFNIPGQGSVRIAGGRMETSAVGCSCGDGSAAIAAHGAAPGPAVGALTATMDPNSVQVASTGAVPPPSSAEHGSKAKQRPQDVVGYARSFIHLMFGR